MQGRTAVIAVAIVAAVFLVGAAQAGNVCCVGGIAKWACADAACAFLGLPCSGQIVAADACGAGPSPPPVPTSGSCISDLLPKCIPVPADGCGTGWHYDAAPCPSVTPTPTPTLTPTPTPTPTAPPLVYTITRILRSTDLAGFNYIMGSTFIDGVLWANGGDCCPGLGDGIGECVISIDYTVTPPAARRWWCTYADTTDLWESGSVQVTHGPLYRWVVAGQATRRPGAWPIVGPWDAFVWSFGAQTLTDEWFSWQHSVGQATLVEPGFRFWPLGILDLEGQRYLYAQWMSPQGEFGVGRWWFPGAGALAQYSRDTFLTLGLKPEPPLFSGIAIDADWSLIATDGWWPAAENVVVRVWRSRDAGRTWALTGQQIEAPPGTTLFGCGWIHREGGFAVQPWAFVCNQGTGKGAETGDWSLVVVRTGTKPYVLPAALGAKPGAWIPRRQLPAVTPTPRP